MPYSGQKLRKRIGRLLAAGWKDKAGLGSAEAAARALPSGPTAKTLRKIVRGDGEGIKALHHAVWLARKSRGLREGLIELMDDRNEATWWRVPRQNLYPANLVVLRSLMGAEPADPSGLLRADLADVTKEQAAAAATIAELEIAIRGLAATGKGEAHTDAFIDRLPANVQAQAERLKEAAARQRSVRRLIETLPQDSELKRLLLETDLKGGSPRSAPSGGPRSR